MKNAKHTNIDIGQLILSQRNVSCRKLLLISFVKGSVKRHNQWFLRSEIEPGELDIPFLLCFSFCSGPRSVDTLMLKNFCLVKPVMCVFVMTVNHEQRIFTSQFLVVTLGGCGIRWWRHFQKKDCIPQAKGLSDLEQNFDFKDATLCLDVSYHRRHRRCHNASAETVPVCLDVPSCSKR